MDFRLWRIDYERQAYDMAIYSGFFDAAFDESTGTYDREYDSVDFTGYFGAFVGSGVCVHGNDESMKVHLDTNTKKVLVNPGYLFIRGYWLKNTALYPIDLSGLLSGTHAIYAKLNLGKRMIEMGHMEKTEAYPDTLVLAYVTISDGMLSIEDTRSNTKICGLIDSSGSLSVKVEFALNYINTQVEDKLNQIEQNLKEQEKVIAGKIEEANSLIAKIAPPAIGTIKFSASQSIEEGWIPCDGRFVNERDYPELVAALGKLTPSGDKFKLLSDGEIGQKITNSVVFAEKLWLYSYTTKKLYGVDLAGEKPTKEISVNNSDEAAFSSFANPTPTSPIVLSIVEGDSETRLFLSQIIKSGDMSASDLKKYVCLFGSSFSGEEETLTLENQMSPTVPGSDYAIKVSPANVVPYVAFFEGKYGCVFGIFSSSRGGLASYTFSNGTGKVITLAEYGSDFYYHKSVIHGDSGQRFGFSPKNKQEALYVYLYTKEDGSGSVSEPAGSKYQVYSENQGLFAVKSPQMLPEKSNEYTNLSISIDIAGDTGIVYGVTLQGFKVAETRRASITTIKHGLTIPSAARVFYDAGAYLFGKAIYMIFVGTGIIFFREFTNESVGYLDTTNVMGTITQYGYLDYSQDENTLYLVGQDTNNKVKVAKMVLNTLFDYANDGAWLPTVAADGVPAYIKAKEIV